MLSAKAAVRVVTGLMTILPKISTATKLAVVATKALVAWEAVVDLCEKVPVDLEVVPALMEVIISVMCSYVVLTNSFYFVQKLMSPLW